MAEMGFNAIRAIIGCVCCLLCIGPILAIVGIVLLIAPNDHAEMVTKFNKAMKNFTSDTLPVLQASYGTIQGTNDPINITSITVDISGSTEGIKDTPIISRPLTTGSIDTRYTQTARIVDNLGRTNSISVPSSVGYSYTSSSSAYCDDSSCSRSEMERYCAKRSSCSSWSHYRSSCNRGSCGTCSGYGTYNNYLCKVMRHSASGWNEDYGKSTCLYSSGSWNSQPTSCSSQTSMSNSYNVQVRFYANTDPFVELQEITKGKMSFGLTAAQQRTLGVALMVIGILITVCVGAVLAFIIRNVCGHDGNRGRVYGAFGRQYQPQGGSNNYQQFPQQQNNYQQQQPNNYQQQSPNNYQPQSGYDSNNYQQQQQVQYNSQPAGYNQGYGAPPQQQGYNNGYGAQGI